MDNSLRAAKAVAREPWIDWLKASAIVTVVWIHARPFVDRPDTPWMTAMTNVSLFAVRAFFFVAGYTLAASSPGWDSVQRRLARLWWPYLVASLLLSWWFDTPARQMLLDLIAGNALGIYYFVPMLAACVLLVAVVRLLPNRVHMVLLVLLALSTPFVIWGFDPFVRWLYPQERNLYWVMRSPARWVGYLAAGFLVGSLRRNGILPHRKVAAAFLGAAALFASVPAVIALPRFGWVWALSSVAMTYLLIAGVVLAVGSHGEAPRVVRTLSSNSYPIYLYHYAILWGCSWCGIGRLPGRPMREFVFILLGVGLPLLIAQRLKSWQPRATKWIG